LRCHTFIGALVLTLVIGLVLPACFRAILILGAFFSAASGQFVNLVLVIGAQVLIALICWERLHWRLRHRVFPLQRLDL
jgi:hypothetical protein